MYKRKDSSWLKHLDFMLVDFILLQIAFMFAHILRYGSLEYFGEGDQSGMTVIIALAYLVAAFSLHNHKKILRRSYKRELFSTVQIVGFVYLGMVLWLFITKTSANFSRLMMGAYPIVAVILVYGGRMLLKLWLRSLKRRGWDQRGILLVCDEENCLSLIETFTNDRVAEFQIRAVAIRDLKERLPGLPENIPCISDKNELMQFLTHDWVDEVFLCTELDPDNNNELVGKCLSMGITVHRALAKVNKTSTHRVLEELGGYMVMSQNINVVDSRRMFLKRTIDVVCGIIGTIITGILCIFLGPIIYIKSPGPIFFKQERIGENGRRFYIYKFRSMYLDAEERKKELMAQNSIKDGRMFKMKNDPRIIKGIGHFMRSYSLDEFPQFWNVLKGDMSVVGTRPPTPDEWEKYEQHHRTRLAVKPGITGAWQVSGRSRITNFEEVVQLDVDYIKHWSLLLDLRIILKTIKVVVKKQGSDNR